MHIVTVLALCVILSLQKNYMRISVLMQSACQKQLILVWTARQGINQRKKSSQKGLLFPRKPGLALKTSVFVSSKEQRFGVLVHKIYSITMVKCKTWLCKNCIFSTDLLCVTILPFRIVPRLPSDQTYCPCWQWVCRCSPMLCLGYVLQSTAENTNTSFIKHMSDCNVSGR